MADVAGGTAGLRGPLLASIASVQADLARLECRRRPGDEDGPAAAKRPNKFEQPRLLLGDRELQLELSRGWLTLLYGVDTKPFEPRGESAAPSQALRGPPVDARLTVALTPAMRARLEALDQRVSQLYAETQGGGDAVEWKPAVRGPTGPSGSYYVTVKALLMPNSAAKRAPTHIKVRHGDGAATKGQGWGYLEPLLKQHGEFRQGYCRVAVVPQIWSMNGQAGLTLLATQMALWRPEAAWAAAQLDIDVLYPDEELLRDELEP